MLLTKERQQLWKLYRHRYDSSKQIKKLELTTKFGTKFCCLSINKISNPKLFQEFRNKLCERTQIVQANLDADLHFYWGYQQSNSKLNLQNRFCQVCRKAELYAPENQLLNLPVDKSLKGKSVAPLQRQRTRRAKILGKKVIAPRICLFLIVFPKNWNHRKF